MPDSLGGLNCYGDLSVDFTIGFLGNIKEINIRHIKIVNDPFINPEEWQFYDSNSASQYMKKVKDWAYKNLQNMKIITNKKHPLWFRDSVRGGGADFDINPQMNPEKSIHCESKDIPIPKCLIPGRSDLQVFYDVWIDRNGRVINYKIHSVYFCKDIKKRWNNKNSISYKDKMNHDIAISPSGEYKITKELRDYIEKLLSNTTYKVDKNHEYFKYHGAVRLFSGFMQPFPNK